ncbi:MAG: amidohydrolase family protein [Hyphomicrobiaceae bacterium]
MARQYGNPKDQADLPGNDQMTEVLAKKHPGKFFPLVGMQLPFLSSADWNAPGASMENLYALTDKKLASGAYYGIGEVIIRHWPYFQSNVKPGPGMDVRKSPDTQDMERLAALAIRNDVPIVIHMEGEPLLVSALERLLQKHRALRLVWSHACGRVDPEIIEAMLQKFPGLFCDLSNMTNTRQGYGYSIGEDYPARKGWPAAKAHTFILEENGSFLPAARRMIERYPDRFVGVGMDNAHRELGQEIYALRADRFRKLLGSLSPDVAEKLAYRNAIRVFRLRVPGLQEP